MVCNCHNMVYLDCPNYRRLRTPDHLREPTDSEKLVRLTALLEDRTKLANVIFQAQYGEDSTLKDCNDKTRESFNAVVDRLIAYLKGKE